MTKHDKVNPIKIVLVGDSGTGKSSLLSRLIKDQVDVKCSPTTGLINEIYHLLIDNKVVEIDIWDLGGQDKYRSIAKFSFHDADGILLVYDISNPASFENVIGWLKDITDNAAPKTVIKLVGNKNDLNDHRDVSMDDVVSFTSKYGLSFTEISAFEAGNNIKKLFLELYVTISSVLGSSNNVYSVSTCGIISKCMTNKDHVEIPIADSLYNDTQPKEHEQEPSFYIVLVDIKVATHEYPPTIHCVEKQLYDDNLKYVAISYRWGELQETVIDTQVGYSAKITSFDLNDFHQLCDLMRDEIHLKDIDYVWVDAICVDQTNDERRKATIYQMSNIYERAEYILAVPDLHKAHLENTSSIYKDIMKESKTLQVDIYHLIHNNFDEFTHRENRMLDDYNVPNDPHLRELLHSSTDHLINGFANCCLSHRWDRAVDRLDDIYKTSQQQKENNDSINITDDDRRLHRLHHFQRMGCRMKPFYPDLSRPDFHTRHYRHPVSWKHLIKQRSTGIRRSMNFMSDLIKDWSTRVWVISEYNIAKKKNNLKFWFIQLGDHIDKDINKFAFFNFKFEDIAFYTTIQKAFIHDGDKYGLETYNDPVYLTFHQTMINQLNQQSFFEMMLKSKASKNVDRFYAIFPLAGYEHMLIDKTKMDDWKIDSLTSVKLKLYQVLNTKDKWNLLFISWDPLNTNEGKVLPTFATSPINWNNPMEHFAIDKRFTTSDYNFDLNNNSSITLVENSKNNSNLPQYCLNIKPKGYYICSVDPNHKLDFNLPLWNKLQPDKDPWKTLTHIYIPSIKHKTLLRYNRNRSHGRKEDIKWDHHVIFLTGNLKTNIWTMNRQLRYVGVLENIVGHSDFITYHACDNKSVGFNIY